MKIGIVSDTHDHLPRLNQALARFEREGVEHILHGGDFCSPFVFLEFKKYNMPFTGVYGNNDGDWIMLYRVAKGAGEVKKGPLSLELGGRRIALMHEPVFLDALADSGHFDLVVYGHLHSAEIRKKGEALILNPGECAGYIKVPPTAMICDLETMEVETIELD